jgi:DNA-binding ferritin-like protein (Dps family)
MSQISNTQFRELSAAINYLYKVSENTQKEKLFNVMKLANEAASCCTDSIEVNKIIKDDLCKFCNALGLSKCKGIETSKGCNLQETVSFFIKYKS